MISTSYYLIHFGEIRKRIGQQCIIEFKTVNVTSLVIETLPNLANNIKRCLLNYELT